MDSSVASGLPGWTPWLGMAHPNGALSVLPTTVKIFYKADFFSISVKMAEAVEKTVDKEAPGVVDAGWGAAQLRKSSWMLGLCQVLLIVFFALFTKQGTISKTDDSKGVVSGYQMFSGVEIMMFIGFGYLMTFLKW